MQELSSQNLLHVPKVFEILTDHKEEKCFIMELLGEFLFLFYRS